MRTDNINADYAYCRGVGCELSNYCKRYLPNPPDAYMWWVQEKYQEYTGRCPHFDENYKD
ncbi:hypothetical protein ABVC73_04830 [Prevotella melaninogenica]